MWPDVSIYGGYVKYLHVVKHNTIIFVVF